MRFRRTTTKREKKSAVKKRLVLLLIIIGLLVLNSIFIYKSFFEGTDPISNPLSKNQISSTKQIEDKLKQREIDFKSLTTESDLKYLLVLKDGAEIILDPGKDIDEQLASLQLILSQLKIEGKTLKRLDFGFEKPVISY